MRVLLLFLKSMAVGGANVMPGVSGATLAVIFRMYDKLIESINELFLNMKKSLKFLVPVGVGMVAGILVVGSVMNVLIDRFSLQTAGFITGLIAGSVPFIYSLAIKPATSASPSKHMKFYAVAVAAAIFIVWLARLEFDSAPVAYGEDMVFNLSLAARLFFGGLFAAAAMVIPGVSGAMIFVIFGLYNILMDTISEISAYLMSPLDFEILRQIVIVAAPLGIGIIAGVLLGSKLIAYLLEKFTTATYFAILGLVFGSVYAVFYAEETHQSYENLTFGLVAFTVIAFACGMILSLRLGGKE
ncbi:MAG: DUF368 domain-containing protein [Defluviitaleaceae bacterium]|nr:DUF368 domain-containing protein [Defluviitaleaceae bacterium]